MKVFMIGGTGLLGSAAAAEFIKRGHSVKSVALPPLPEGAPIPEEMELVFGNYLELSDAELTEMMTGCDCFVFAAGVDERVEFPAPVYDYYTKYNIDPVRHLLTVAKSVGIKNSVILGSYFSYFAKEHPEMELTKKHPYIRSRIEQEEVALSFAKDGEMDVSVLELPYIFGTQPGRKPVWVILIEQLSNMGPITMYPKGGTTMVTVRQVAEVIVGAAERNKGGNAYPVGYYNLTWDEFLH
ncbi:MAG: NAD-dependent epimerase/dehydratase family protein, partial [Clostridiaceae bacterium]|nr:NAD-dependent epimerase/dehydratase family protein [Clostridiaceae bacterium]MDY5889495.1 NAD-dependent epimerase/dehydratase family protein [Oscillospiraceae bacterium]